MRVSLKKKAASYNRHSLYLDVYKEGKLIQHKWNELQNATN